MQSQMSLSSRALVLLGAAGYGDISEDEAPTASSGRWERYKRRYLNGEAQRAKEEEERRLHEEERATAMNLAGRQKVLEERRRKELDEAQAEKVQEIHEWFQEMQRDPTASPRDQLLRFVKYFGMLATVRMMAEGPARVESSALRDYSVSGIARSPLTAIYAKEWLVEVHKRFAPDQLDKSPDMVEQYSQGPHLMAMEIFQRYGDPSFNISKEEKLPEIQWF